MIRSLVAAGLILPPLAAGCREGAGAAPATSAIAAVASGASADPLLLRGDSVYAREEYDSAAVVFGDALRAARVQRNPRAEARALTSLGLSAWRTGKYSEARHYGESALLLKHQLKYREELFRSYNALGLLAWNEGRLLDARAMLDSASAAAGSVGDKEGLGKAAGNRALVQVELGEFGSARSGLQLMLQSARQTGNRKLQGNAFTNLAMLDLRVGRPADALAPLDSARRLYQEINYVTGAQAVLGQLGTVRVALGDYREAFAVLDSALSLERKQNLEQDVASTLEAIADLHAQTGELRRALGLYAEAQEINQRLGIAVEQASDLRNQAELYRELGEGASAVRSAREALRIHREQGAAFEELHDLVLLSETAPEEGDSNASGRYLGSAKLIANRLNTRSARIEVMLADARKAERAKSPRQVIAVLHQAARDLAAAGYGVEWQACDLEAGAWLALGHADSAALAARRAVDAIERVRGSLGSGAQRTSFLAGRSRAYTRLMEAMLRQGHTEEAFMVADAMRGRGLLEHLASSGTTDSGAALRRLAEGDSLLRQITALEERISRLEAEQDAQGDSAFGVARAQLVTRLTQSRDGYEAWLGQHPGSEMRALDLLGNDRADPAVIRRALAPDEALLAYILTEARVHLFVLRRDRLTHREIPVSGEEIAARVRLARDLLGHPGTGAPAPVLTALDDLLIEPARRGGELGGIRRLIVVPHGVLTYLPFAALHEAGSGRYLAEDYVISLLPSAGALLALKNRPRGQVTPSVAVFAPTPEGLPWSRQEAVEVRAEVHEGQTWEGASATEALARRALGTTAIVHFASHATLNANNPLFSRIELAPGMPGRPEDDGRLEVHELLELRARSDLVFLSGCETGVGNAGSTAYGVGEDYATLGQALLYAGVMDVVATLWRIDDRSAAALAGRFYAHLATRPPAEALALAQRDLIRDSRFRNPYYWAAYQVTGTP